MGSRFRAVTMAGGLALAACSPAKQDEAKTTAPKTAAEAASARAPSGRKAYFGAVHVHTSISFDAFGYLKKWFVAANWWATRRWRFSLGYGQGTLDKGGLVGQTNQTLARVQWIF